MSLNFRKQQNNKRGFMSLITIDNLHINVDLQQLQNLEKLLKELKNMAKKTQADIDALAQQVEDGNRRAIAALEEESKEIQAAINSPDIDTSALESAIAQSGKIDEAIKNLYTAPSEEPEEPETPEEPTEPTEPPEAEEPVNDNPEGGTPESGTPRP
jgi:uncharacterized protein (DUF885 family)